MSTPLDPTQAASLTPTIAPSVRDDRRQQLARSLLFPQLAAPPRIGRFVVEGVLGAGAMGVVYRARDARLNRTVAVKVLRVASEPRATARLLREAQGLAQINHPNVVTIFEVGEIDAQPFIAMEYVTGPTLRTWAEGQDRRAIMAAYQAAARGLAAVHAVGLVHRDFKPANVLVGTDNVARVADFGLVGVVDVGVGDDAIDAPSSALQTTDWKATTTGAVLGTPAYMAPEQAGGVVGAAADQFAFCVALYEALTGAVPIEARQGDSVPRRGLPRRLHRVLSRGMALAPANRWPSMDALLAAMNRPPWEVISGGAALAAVGLVAVLALQTDPLPSPAPLIDADPAIAAGVLAESPLTPDWTTQAWQTLHTPMTHVRSRLPFDAVHRVIPRRNGSVVVTDEAGALMVHDSQGWHSEGLMRDGVGMLMGSAAPIARLRSLQIEALDWTDLPGSIPRHADVFARQGGWLLRWQNNRLDPITPFAWTHVLGARQAARLLAFNAGEPVWSVPLDGSAARPIPGSEGAGAGASSPKHDALALPDGRVLLVPFDGPLQVLEGRVSKPHLQFSPDGQWLVAAGAQVRIWHVAGRYPPLDPPGQWLPLAAFSRDSQRLLLARVDHGLVEWSLRTRQSRLAQGHTAGLRHIEATADGWVSAGDDGTLRTWRMSAGGSIGRLPGVWSAYLDPSGTQVVATGRAGVVGVFDIDGVQPAKRWQHGTGDRPVNGYRAHFSPDGAAVLSGATDGVARIWPVHGGAPLELPGHAGWAYALAFAPDGQRIATADKHGVVRLWSRAGDMLRQWQGDRVDETRRIHHLTFADDGRALAWAHRHGPARWAPIDGDARIIAPGHGDIKRAADGHLFSSGPRAVDWFSPKGERLNRIAVESAAIGAHASPNAKLLAISTADRRVWFESPTGQPGSGVSVGPLPGTIEFGAFSPDGGTFAAGYPTGQVELIDVSTGRRWPLGMHASAVRAVLWPRVDTVVTASIDGELLRWAVDRDPEALRARLAQATTVCLSPAERQTWLADAPATAEAARCDSEKNPR